MNPFSDPELTWLFAGIAATLTAATVVGQTLRLAVPAMSNAPTVMAEGALPGELMPAYPTTCVVGSPPLLPADTTTTMPARTACSTACTSGSLAAGSNTGWPSDMLMTSMPSAALLATAKFKALTTVLV